MDDRFIVYENRLSSFLGPQTVTKQRLNSNAASSRAPKTLSWPHKFLPPFELAKAGFYFDPHPGNPDNVVCFLCNKNMDGWEPDDSPIEEHLKHSPDCGWAVTAAVEAECQGMEQVDPRDPRMVEARKATFAGKWPYESKKSWKCKTKQLAEAGWIYTPTNESDDNTTCAYCQLSLDGWEAGDKPMDEHFKRSSNCPFFELINKNPAPPKKVAKSRLPRGSKISRVSAQSTITTASDVTSIAEVPADLEDSVMTMSSVMTTASKKTSRTRKVPAPKARKTKAKKDEPVEIHEDVDAQDVEMPPPPPPKPARGRKRASESVEDSALTNAEAPAPKKRAAKARGSQNPDVSIVTTASQTDIEMAETEVRPKATAAKKRAATTSKSKSRKASAASVASTATAASVAAQDPADDELERQLQADLERPLTDEEMAVDSDSESKKAPPAAAKPKANKAAPKKSAARESVDDYAMFDPAPAQPDDESVEAELHALEAEELAVPKKGRKPAARKVSKQIKKAEEPEPEAEMEPEAAQPEPASEPSLAADQVDEDNDVEVFHDASEVHESSTATVVQQEAPPPKRGRGRPKKSTASRVSVESRQSSRISAVSVAESKTSSPPTAEPSRKPEPATEKASATAATSKSRPVTTPDPVSPPAQKALPVLPSSASRQLPPPPATPSAKQAAISPSQSPQSSDAENQPPSSKPTATAVLKKVVLAPSSANQQHHYDVTSTPVRGSTASPSKRLQGNPRTIGGLQSTTPWTEVDLDLVFAEHGLDGEGFSADKENGGGLDSAAARFFSKGSDLTSPERRMTVEEWIYYNAGQAEKKLRQECEALVSSFEREGSRAMRVLEEIVVEP